MSGDFDEFWDAVENGYNRGYKNGNSDGRTEVAKAVIGYLTDSFNEFTTCQEALVMIKDYVLSITEGK